jgi:uncharacterized repeat protein (TIGR01451 family)
MRTFNNRRWIIGMLGAAIMAAPLALAPAGGVAAAASGPDTIQYNQTTGSSGSYIKYVPGDGSTPTTQSVKGGGGCATPTPSGLPILGLAARYYNTASGYQGTFTPAVVGAYNGRTGVCAISPAWAIDQNESLLLSPGTNSLVAGRIFTAASIQISQNGKGSFSTQIQLVETLAGSAVATQPFTITGGDGTTITASTGTIAGGFDAVEVRTVSPSTGSTSVTGPTSTFTLGGQSLGLTKTDSLNGAKYDHVGQVVNYTLTATNTGYGTLQNVVVSDNPVLANFACIPAVPTATLAPAAKVVCTGSHTVTQADIDAGSYSDTGSASATGLTSVNATDVITAAQRPALSLIKTDSLNGTKYANPGQVVTYTLTATNSGNTTLQNVVVSDNPVLANFACIPTIPTAGLAPAAKVVCTGSHTVTQADIDAGSYSDTGSASATGVTAVNATDVITAAQNPALSLIKTDSLNGTKYANPSQVVTYTLTATNSGNTTLQNVVVSDNPVLANFACAPTVPTATLAPAAKVVCTGSHTVTQADIDAGSYSDTGSASATGVTAVNATDTITAAQNPALSLIKTDSLNGTKYANPGQVVTYTLTATNSGNTTLQNVVVSDNPVLANFACTPSSGATLAPGASVVCTGSHTVTQADIDAGSYSDTGSASATGVTAVNATDTITAAQRPALSLIKTDSLNGAYVTAPGQVITYTLAATNSGNTTLHNVTVSDIPSLAGFSCTPSITAATLVPGASVVCTGKHTISIAEMTAGFYSDTGSASSTEVAAPDSTDTVRAQVKQICTGQTLTDTSVGGTVTAGTIVASVTVASLPVGFPCKGYTYYAADANDPNSPTGKSVTFLSQPLSGAHVTATFDWGYAAFCQPNAQAGSSLACPVTYVDFGSGLQAQTFCAAADPNNVAVPWCTTSRSYQYVTVHDPGNPIADANGNVVVTHITETWDGYGDILFRH